MSRKRALLPISLALAAAVCLGAAEAAPPDHTGMPWDGVAPARSATHGKGEDHWNEHFQGRGNVTNTRCLGMSRGPNCITAASREEAARRAAALRALAGNTAPQGATAGGEGK